MTIYSFKRSLVGVVAKEMFTKGQGGFLIFLMVFGGGIIGIGGVYLKMTQSLLFLESIFFLVCILAGYAIFRTALLDPEACRSAMTALLESQYPIDQENTAYDRELTDGLRFAREAIQKMLELSEKSDDRKSLSQIFDDVIEMLDMQHDSAVNVEESRRVLDLVTSDCGKRQRKHQPLLDENIKLMQEYITEAEGWIGEINDRLRTVTLQVAQLETRTSHQQANAATFAKETSETLRRLQGAIEARKAAAANVIRQLQYS